MNDMNAHINKLTADQILTKAKSMLEELEKALGGQYEFHIGVFEKPKIRPQTFNRVNTVS